MPGQPGLGRPPTSAWAQWSVPRGVEGVLCMGTKACMSVDPAAQHTREQFTRASESLTYTYLEAVAGTVPVSCARRMNSAPIALPALRETGRQPKHISDNY